MFSVARRALSFEVYMACGRRVSAFSSLAQCSCTLLCLVPLLCSLLQCLCDSVRVHISLSLSLSLIATPFAFLWEERRGKGTVEGLLWARKQLWEKRGDWGRESTVVGSF